MELKSRIQWKEELIITDEQGNSFCFGCGWGAEPPVAYIPSRVGWIRRVPGWLTDRRLEVIELIKQEGHLVKDWPYPEVR